MSYVILHICTDDAWHVGRRTVCPTCRQPWCWVAAADLQRHTSSDFEHSRRASKWKSSLILRSRGSTEFIKLIATAVPVSGVRSGTQTSCPSKLPAVRNGKCFFRQWLDRATCLDWPTLWPCHAPRKPPIRTSLEESFGATHVCPKTSSRISALLFAVMSPYRSRSDIFNSSTIA